MASGVLCSGVAVLWENSARHPSLFRDGDKVLGEQKLAATMCTHFG
jgi:hypothetical protein